MAKSYSECDPGMKVEILRLKIGQAISADPGIAKRIEGFISARSGGLHTEVGPFAMNGTASEKKLEVLEKIYFSGMRDGDWKEIDADSFLTTGAEAHVAIEEDEEERLMREELELKKRQLEEVRAKKAAAAAAAAKPAAMDEGRIKAIIAEALAAFKPEAAPIELTPALCGVIEAHAKGVINGTVRDIIGSPVPVASPVAAHHTAKCGAFRPDADATYVIKPDLEAEFKALVSAAAKSPQNVAVVGPHGCGKTELAIQLAARNKRPMFIVDCANVREARDWWGYKTAIGGCTGWHRSQFDIAVSEGFEGVPCVIVLDEWNRVAEAIKNTLYPMMDARRATYVEEKGDFIRVMAGTIFIITFNEGHQYTGTGAQDTAMSDRFPRRLEVNYLSPSEEAGLIVKRTEIGRDDADKLVDIADTVRRKCAGYGSTLTRTISTRQLLAAAHNFVAMGAAGLRSTILNHFSPEGGKESEREQVKLMLLGKFPMLSAGAAEEESDEPKLA